jgi:hypothetical protein
VAQTNDFISAGDGLDGYVVDPATCPDAADAAAANMRQLDGDVPNENGSPL